LKDFSKLHPYIDGNLKIRLPQIPYLGQASSINLSKKCLSGINCLKINPNKGAFMAGPIENPRVKAAESSNAASGSTRRKRAWEKTAASVEASKESITTAAGKMAETSSKAASTVGKKAKASGKASAGCSGKLLNIATPAVQGAAPLIITAVATAVTVPVTKAAETYLDATVPVPLKGRKEGSI